MSSLGSPNPFFIAGKKAYEVERSLRFNKSDSMYLERTPSSTGNQKVWTWSAWFKRTLLHDTGGTTYLFSSNNVSGNDGIAAIYINNDKISTYFDSSGSSPYGAVNDRLYRDVGAWMHIVWQVDAANTSQRIWINGVEETLNSGNNPPDFAYGMNQSGIKMFLGRDGDWGADHSNIYFAEVHFSDGNKYQASDFAETDATTGQWVPKSPSISYGTNGFYLNFSDNSGTTATTLGKDSSGNGNNFTPNNFSVADGIDGDSFADTPTNNFCTLNPLVKSQSAQSLSNGNLQRSGNAYKCVGTFLLKNNKYYFEVKVEDGNGNAAIGVTQADTDYRNRDNTEAAAYFPNGEYKIEGSGQTSGFSTYGNGDIIGVAIDTTLSTPKVWFAKNNTWQGTGDPSTTGYSLTSGKDYVFNIDHGSSGSSTTATAFFGGHKGEFNYTPPTGFVAASSANLPDPTILLPNKHFDTKLWSGNSSTQAITGLNFSPDWVWSKRRSASSSHYLSDTIRGVHKILFSELTGAEYDGTSNNDGVDSFDSNGFTLQNGTYVADYNASGSTYVGWSWNAGDTDGKTYTVTVVDDSGNKYRFDGFGTSAVTLDLAEGGTYTFDQSDSSMSSHPMQLSTTANGTHGGGSAYSTGVTYELDGSTVTASAFISGFSSASSRKLIITVAASAPTLYYYCYYHSGMGGQVNTNSTLGSSNFAGSRQATTKVNATAGFSIVTSTSGGSSSGTYDSFGHGLGVAPNVIIFKNRDISDNWGIYNSNFSTAYSKILQFNTIAETTSSNYWGTANPSSTTFSLNQGSVFNGADEKLVAYCFSEVAGYSKFGKYTGNGNADGTFVFLGFRPAWILIKRTDSASEWSLFDTARKTFNVGDLRLEPNSSSAEDSNSVNYHDILSNGFKMRNSDAARNGSGATYIYLAFAESPFRNARAR